MNLSVDVKQSLELTANRKREENPVNESERIIEMNRLLNFSENRRVTEELQVTFEIVAKNYNE